MARGTQHRFIPATDTWIERIDRLAAVALGRSFNAGGRRVSRVSRRLCPASRRCHNAGDRRRRSRSSVECVEREAKHSSRICCGARCVIVSRGSASRRSQSSEHSDFERCRVHPRYRSCAFPLSWRSDRLAREYRAITKISAQATRPQPIACRREGDCRIRRSRDGACAVTQYNLDRVCIVMMSAVGDSVHVLPVINAIKREHPSSRITWVLQPGPASLVRGHPAVDDIIIFDRTRGLGAFADVRRELSRRQFDLLIDLQVYLKAGIVTALSRAPVRLGFDRARARDVNWLFTNRRIPASPMKHVQDQYFEFLSEIGISPEPIEWNLGPWADERKWQQSWVASVNRPYAVIVVATSKPDKDWIPEKWAAVCDVLENQYELQPVLVGGDSPREKEAAERI